MYYYFSIEVLVLVLNRCMISIILVYTTSVDIDQNLLTRMSQPNNLVHNICMSDVSDYCVLVKFANIRLKIICFVLLSSEPFQSFHVMPRPKFQSFHEIHIGVTGVLCAACPCLH